MKRYQLLYKWIIRICLGGILIIVMMDLFLKQYLNKSLYNITTFLLALFLIIALVNEVLIKRWGKDSDLHKDD